ncbi:MAG: hypothetical protein DSZ33_01545 [Gammaproteobacteria bacterium]|nr:MAG: hypothetical protein DSZ33_01545 [Gammaproteobacteria bacterium]
MGMSDVLRILLLACCLSQTAVADRSETARIVVRENMPGSEPVEHRILVSPDFMRMDIVGDNSGYLLLDRKKRLIHNINLEDNTDLLISKSEISLKPPVPFENETTEVEGGPLPAIAGHPTRHYRISTNHAVCHDIVVLDGALQDAARALTELNEVLASEQAVGLATAPKEFVNDCELAASVFEPGRQYRRGFPVREQDWRGRLRELIDFEESFNADAGLFTVPDGLETMTMEEIRGE